MRYTIQTARGISTSRADRPMHILLDARAATNPQSDLARYCRGVTEGLIPLLAPDEQLTVIFARHADLPNVSREHCRLRRAHHNLHSWAGQHEIARIVRRTRPDIVWTPTPKFLPPAGNAAIVIVDHDRPYGRERSFRALFRINTFRRILLNRRLRRAHAIICPTHALAQALAAGDANPIGKKIHIIPDGHSSALRPATGGQIEALRRAYCLPPRYLLATLNPDDPHAIDILLDAIARSKETDLQPLVILADTQHAHRLEAIIRDRRLEGRVRPETLKRPEDLRPFLSAATLLLEPAYSPTFPSTILSAMACGTPVIAAATPAHIELGACAIFRVHPTDPVEWKKAIIQAILSPVWQERFKKEGLERAARFTWRDTAEQTLALLRTLPKP